MTTIKATCPTCGEIDLTARDIALRIAASDHEASAYSFECPICVCRIWKPADERIIQLLLSGGVKAVFAEPIPDITTHPPFTYDDLLDFHFELEREESLKSLSI